VAEPVVVIAVTVSVTVPDILPDVAVMVVVPAATPVAKPLEPDALLTDAIALFDELQVTDAVIVCFVLSEYVPVATSCTVEPVATEGFVGVTAILTRVAGVTARVVVAIRPPVPAVIAVVPAARHVARPFEPDVLLIDATVVFEELQATVVVRFCVLPSE
jgi:hypothetical protein